ncbi:Nucleoid occlusion protein [bacterium HR39]|nr:Nucleoid occlusion protein [bacterium HR39]
MSERKPLTLREEEVPVHLVDLNAYQNRTLDLRDGVARLAESIRRYGLLAPIVVYRKGDGRFGLVAGERRLRAARDVLGWERIPARVLEAEPDPELLLRLTVEENQNREGVSYMGRLAAALRWAALRTGRSLEEVAEVLFLLRKGQRPPEDIAGALREAAASLGLSPASLFHYLIPLRTLHREVPALAFLLVRAPLSYRVTQDLVEGVLALPPERREEVVSRLEELLSNPPRDLLPRLYRLLGKRLPTDLRAEVEEVPGADLDSLDPLTRLRREVRARARGNPPEPVAALKRELRELRREAAGLEKLLEGASLPYGDGEREVAPDLRDRALALAPRVARARHLVGVGVRAIAEALRLEPRLAKDPSLRPRYVNALHELRWALERLDSLLEENPKV